MATIEASQLFPETNMDHESAVASSPGSDSGFRGFVRRLSHSFSHKNDPASVEKLVEMGFPRRLAERQLSSCNGNVQQAAEYMVHAAHPPGPKEDMWNHPDCPICVREKNNVAIAEARAPSLGNVLQRWRSRDSASAKADKEKDKDGAAATTTEGEQPALERRGSVGAMLRRPSISAALARMTSRDLQHPTSSGHPSTKH